LEFYQETHQQSNEVHQLYPVDSCKYHTMSVEALQCEEDIDWHEVWIPT